MIQQPIAEPRKRRGKSALIDPERVRYLVIEGMTIPDIADLYEVSRNAIVGICGDYGIALDAGRPTKAKVKARPKDPEVVERKTVACPDTREATLVATGGRYADLRAWAARWGVTETKARQEWHKLRLPVGKGGCL